MKTAVIIHGNPYYVNGMFKSLGDKFYKDIEIFLYSLGFEEVTHDPGKPYTSPKAADFWIGHSRGADRLRFAPQGTLAIPIGSDQPGAVNHPVDAAFMKVHKTWLDGRSLMDIPVEERLHSPKEHFILTSSMASEIKRRIQAHRLVQRVASHIL